MKTFTQSIKEEVVQPGEEKTVFSAEGAGTVTHMWFGGSYEYFSDTILFCKDVLNARSVV